MVCAARAGMSAQAIVSGGRRRQSAAKRAVLASRMQRTSHVGMRIHCRLEEVESSGDTLTEYEARRLAWLKSMEGRG